MDASQPPLPPQSQSQTQPDSQAIPSPAPPSSQTHISDARAANRARFELELEFVQALANPFYLHSLAQQNILSQPAFVNYLEYLLYWKEKDYARFIHYPHALHHLELLQHAQFRAEIAKDEWREYLNHQQFHHWRTWREPRLTAMASATNGNAAEDGLPAEGAPPVNGTTNGGMNGA